MRGPGPGASLLAVALGCRSDPAAEPSGSPPAPSEPSVGDSAGPDLGDTGDAGVGAADCSDAPVRIRARAGDVRKVCLFADGATCTIHADDPAATSCAVHTSLLNFEWKLDPPQARRLLELYDWTAIDWSAGDLETDAGPGPDTLDLTALPLGTAVTVRAEHDATSIALEVRFSFEADALAVDSVVQ